MATGKIIEIKCLAGHPDTIVSAARKHEASVLSVIAVDEDQRHVNVVAVNLAAQTFFLLRGIRPRSWLEQRAAEQSSRLNLLIWIGLLVLVVTVVVVLAESGAEL